MVTSTIEITQESRELLQALAHKTRQSETEVLGRALAVYRRQVFFEEMNAGYADLRADQNAWLEHEAERKQFDSTLADGLNEDK